MPFGTENSRLAIAHVLFIDIVGYSKLLTNEQRERLQELNRIVRETEQFREAEAAGQLVRVPTGDGMVLAFFGSPDTPVRCAVAISHALRGTTHLPLRMGIHSGPVDFVEDVNDKPNLAGGGVNIAQRVMACGDAGHILLSSRAADDLAQYGEWKAQLHGIGEAEVKHGVRVRILSLHGDNVGNAELPRILRRQRVVRRRRLGIIATTVAVLIIGSAFGIWAWQRHLDSLRQAASEAAAQRAKSVAVLPFENLSTEEKNAVFAGGVHREVLSDLAKVADLKVISRTSVMRYKPGAGRNLREIAGELGVSYVVEGSVQREGDHVRVAVELIDARTDSQTWAETYDGKVEDILTFQNEIAERIANQLGAKLSQRESTELAAPPTRDIAAFESYGRARALMETKNDDEKFEEDYARAVQLLEQAVARDPQFAAAYWALAEANIDLFHSVEPAKPEYRDRAEAALKEAQRIAPEAGETFLTQARIIYYGYRDYGKALSTLEHAAKLLPNNAEVSLTRGNLYRRVGRWQEAFAQYQRAAELNPEDPDPYYGALNVAQGLRWWDEFDRVRTRMGRRFPRLERDVAIMHAAALRIRGDIEAGDKELENLHLDLRENGDLFFLNTTKGDYAECRRILDEWARYHPEIVEERPWQMELILHFLSNGPFDRSAALETEKRVEARLAKAEGAADGPLRITLSAVKMLLGKKEEAIRIGEECVARHPVSADFMDNPQYLRWLAWLYVCAGENERALQTFARLAQIPSGFYYGPLKYDPAFEALRKDPRFAEILKQAQQPFPRL